MKALALTLLSAAICVSPACEDQDQPTRAPLTLSTWTEIHQSVIAPSCAFASCHAGAAPAAHLDLSQPSACTQLINRPSCLFPRQMLVTPHAPENSFLVNKLTGDQLTAAPETPCGGATNQRMPFGAQPLPADKIAAVSAWIAAGADCDDGNSSRPNQSAASDAGTDATSAIDNGTGGSPSEPVVVVQAVTADRTTLVAGTSIELSISLSGPAGPAGLAIRLDVSDRSVLAAPVAVLIPAGNTVVTIEAVGKRPGSTEVRARPSGTGSGEPFASLRVTGLVLTELLAAGASPAPNGTSWVKIANFSQVPIDLSAYRLRVSDGTVMNSETALPGILPPQSCFLVGGPRSDGENGGPRYNMVWDFSTILQHGPEATADAINIGLFDGSPSGVGSALALDELALTSASTDGVGRPAPTDLGGMPSAPAQRRPAAGTSLVRPTFERWEEQMVPTPGICQLPSAI